MKELLAVILLLSLGLITFWPPVRSFLDGYLARVDAVVTGDYQRGHLYWYFLFGSILVSFWILQPKLHFLKPYAPSLVALTSIILLTGVYHCLMYSSFIVNVVVGCTYGLGVLGLYSAYQSIRCRDKQKRWLLLITGFLSVLIAYFTLEALL